MFVDGFVGQFIGTLVAWVAAMPFYPMPIYLVSLGLFVEGLPQLGILDGLLGCRFPAALDPVMNPLGNALTHVLRVDPPVSYTHLTLPTTPYV
jgi:hypothetical protein